MPGWGLRSEDLPEGIAVYPIARARHEDAQDEPLVRSPAGDVFHQTDEAGLDDADIIADLWPGAPPVLHGRPPPHQHDGVFLTLVGELVRPRVFRRKGPLTQCRR